MGRFVFMAATKLKRMTDPIRRVLVVLLEDPTGQHYGYEVHKRSGTTGASAKRILDRLVEHGWVTDEWEEIDQVAEGRPRRRYFRLTPDGISMAKATLANSPSTVPSWRPDPGVVS
jgi:DNA-binding PadR family transcriptional regulator